MHHPEALTVSRVEARRSRLLIQDSRALIASAQEVLHQARQSLARQRYRKIVCAWCQQTIRWERFAHAAWGQSSHSICFDCFAGVFQELEPGTAMPTLPETAAHAHAARSEGHTRPRQGLYTPSTSPNLVW